MKKEEILFLAVLVGGILAFVGFYPTKTVQSKGGAATSVDWGSVEDDLSEKLTIKWLGPPVYANAQEGTWIEQMLEARFNVDLQPVLLDWNANTRLKPLMLSSGDVPDIVWDGDPLYVRRNVHHGFVMELPYEVILEHAPTYVEYLNEYGRETWLFAFYRGKNYGIPTFAASDIYPRPGAWRMDWLRKVGIEQVPQNLEEMHDALWKFRHEDPDGNGVVDTYGFNPRIHWSLSFVDIFSAYGLLPQDFILRDGRAVWGGVQPEAKEVLALLRRWYEEELIDPDFAIGSQSTNQTAIKFQNGRTGYFYKAGSWQSLNLNNPNSMYSIMKQIDPAVELAPGAPLLGRDGMRRDRVWGGPAHVMWFGKQVAQEPQKVLRVLRIFEALAKERDLFVESRLGRRGEHWEWSAEVGLYMLPPYDVRGADTRHLLSIGMFENAYGFYSACSAPLDYTDPYLPAGQTAFRMRHAHPDWGLKNAVGKSDVVDSAGRYLEDLRQFQSTVFVEIIRGDQPLDYFDEFVRLWRARGGDVITQEANEMLQQMYDIYRKVGIGSEELGLER